MFLLRSFFIAWYGVVFSSADNRLRRRRRLLPKAKVYGADPDPMYFPLQRCEGDCDSDADCDEGLICHQRDAFQDIPGCEPAHGQVDESNSDYCLKPEDLVATSEADEEDGDEAGVDEDVTSTTTTTAASTGGGANEPVLINFVGDKVPPDSFPVGFLGRCEGDCDTNADCDVGLICFQRTNNMPIPGCKTGTGNPDSSRTDYCVRVEDVPVTPAPTATPTVSPAPTSPPNPQIEFIPGTEPWALLPANAPRLGLCQGDCHMDADCQQGLHCHQREPYDHVPGCEGAENDPSNHDYCTYVAPTMPPSHMPAPFPQPTANYFRLRMHWEPHYFWQEELFERKWCMECKGGCVNGNFLHLDRCRGESTYMNFVDLPKTDPNKEQEILMRMDGTNSCMERDADLGDGWPEYTPIRLQECDGSNPRQRWYATGGDLNGPLLEIGQYDIPGYCISQQHFPKYGELVRMEGIAKARYDTTSYWVRH